MIEILLGPWLAVFIARKWADASWFFLLGFMIFGLGDLIITYKEAGQKPWLEGNPLVRIFLYHPYGLILGSFLWTLTWLWIYSKISFKWLVALGLSIGHLWGWLSWRQYWDTEMFFLMFIGSVGILILVYPYILVHNEKPGPE